MNGPVMLFVLQHHLNLLSGWQLPKVASSTLRLLTAYEEKDGPTQLLVATILS